MDYFFFPRDLNDKKSPIKVNVPSGNGFLNSIIGLYFFAEFK